MNEIDNNNQIVSPSVSQSLIEDLRQIIEQARGQVAATANYAQTMMYWHVGERINREVLGNQRAEYGKQIVSAVSTKITWSHIIEILPLKDDLQREFYLTLASTERWSMRQLRKEIDGMLFERTAISGKPDEFIKSNSASWQKSKNSFQSLIASKNP